MHIRIQNHNVDTYRKNSSNLVTIYKLVDRLYRWWATNGFFSPIIFEQKSE